MTAQASAAPVQRKEKTKVFDRIEAYIFQQGIRSTYTYIVYGATEYLSSQSAHKLQRLVVVKSAAGMGFRASSVHDDAPGPGLGRRRISRAVHSWRTSSQMAL